MKGKQINSQTQKKTPSPIQKSSSRKSNEFREGDHFQNQQTPLKESSKGFPPSDSNPSPIGGYALSKEQVFNENPIEDQEFESEEEAMFLLLNAAAIMIQKVWKGHHTRKMLNYYIIEALKELNPEEINEKDSPFVNQGNNIETPAKSSKVMRKSHSLDNIYEAGNLFKDEIWPKEKNEGKIEHLFNEEEKAEFKQKLQLVQNQHPENFDYYQLGNKAEEIQFDIKAPENGVAKLIDNNLFYGKKNGALPIENNKIEPLSLSKKDLDKSEHITNVSHLNEEIIRQGILSEKNIQMSNLNIGSNNTFQDRKGSLENEPEPEDLKEIISTSENEKKPIISHIKWEEFLNYMKICCQKPELLAPAQRFLETLQNLPVSTLKSLVNFSEQKDQEIQARLSPNQTQESRLTENEIIKPGRKSSKNLQIEIEEEEEKLKENEKIQENEKNSLKESKNPPLPDMRRVFGDEQLLRSESLSLSASPMAEFSGNNNASLFEQNPFREFTSKKMREFLNKENMLKVIRFREKALTLRHQAQLDLMKEMFDNKRVSPRTFRSKSEEIEKWVTLEREDLLRKKIDIEKGWLSAALTIKRTQRDLMFMRKSLTKSTKNPNFSLQKSYSQEELGIFESFEDYKLQKLEKQDEVLKASNEKTKENNEIFEQKTSNIVTSKLDLEENPRVSLKSLGKKLTNESIQSISPNNREKANSPLNIPLGENTRSMESLARSAMELCASNEIKRNSLETYEILKQKISEIPKILSHEDFGSLSGSSGNLSLSNSKLDMVKFNDKKIDQVTLFVMETLMEELKTDNNMMEILKNHRINNNISQKSPKVGGFVAGKDIQEHFPPLNSPSREEIVGKKIFKEPMLSPKNLSI